ncbi:MAG: LacI family DNA-binding transcriptional regulator [Brevefilum sp.]
MTTIKEIAKLTGVSRSTVSRVINNDPNVSDKTRTLVQEIIDRVGYQPNPVARSLICGRARVLGLVIPMNYSSLFTDPFFGLLAQGISSTCTANNYTLMLWLIEPDYDKRANNNIINNRLIDGIIVASNMINDPLIDALVERKVPLVQIGRNRRQEVSSVDADNIHGSLMAVKHLINGGRRKLATVTGHMDLFSSRDRLAGFKRGLEENNLPILEERIAFGDFTENGGYLQTKSLLSRTDLDGLYIASDMMAFGAIRAIEEEGLCIPDDIALISFDDIPAAARHHPALSTIRQPIHQMGAIAAQTLIDQLENDDTATPRRIILPTELVLRETTPKLTSTSTYANY